MGDRSSSEIVSGDHADAKKEIKSLLATIGFAPIDLGSLAFGGRMQQADGPLSAQNLILLN